MDRNEIYKQSPLRILERQPPASNEPKGDATERGLGRGNLGVVMAPAGVGKTAFLVHVALDGLLRECKVLHVSLDSPVDHVRSWYDAVYQDLARATQLSDAVTTAEMINHNRIIQAFSLHGHGVGQTAFSVDKLRGSLDLLMQHAQFRPDLVLIDAFDWSRTSDAEIESLSRLARERDIELWMTALTHRQETGPGVPERVPPPCDRFKRHLNLVLFLQPIDSHLSVRVIKRGPGEDSRSARELGDTHLVLYPDTMRLAFDRAPNAPLEDLPPAAYTLLSGGAEGAEAEFGACAERYNLREENFSFEGHKVVRTRGLKLLSDEELRDGDVSLAYVSATMHRPYHQNPVLRKVLQSIWHQVNSSQEVFIIGVIQPDDTVKGGTGWAAELARHQQKPLHVYDQEKHRWFSWDHKKRVWLESRPTIRHTRFTGTGTRSLTEEGRAAITELFTRSFRRSRSGRSGPTT